MTKVVAKQLRDLFVNLPSFTANQAELADWEDDFTCFCVNITPSDGLFAKQTYSFEVSSLPAETKLSYY